jgi:hypothetical protein
MLQVGPNRRDDSPVGSIDARATPSADPRNDRTVLLLSIVSLGRCTQPIKIPPSHQGRLEIVLHLDYNFIESSIRSLR